MPMAARAPVVATDVGACREVLEGGRFGALVPPGDPDMLAQAIARLLEDKNQVEARAGAAQARAFSTFTIDAMASAYARCLRLAS